VLGSTVDISDPTVSEDMWILDHPADLDIKLEGDHGLDHDGDKDDRRHEDEDKYDDNDHHNRIRRIRRACDGCLDFIWGGSRKRDDDSDFEDDDRDEVINEELCYKNLKDVEQWLEDQRETDKENKKTMNKLLEDIWDSAAENDVSITGNKAFLEWAAWHNIDGQLECDVTPDGDELCFRPEIDQDLIDTFLYSDGFISDEDLMEALLEVVHFRGAAGIEPEAMYGLPLLPDTSMCKSKWDRERGAEMRDEYYDSITFNLDLMNATGFLERVPEYFASVGTGARLLI